MILPNLEAKAEALISGNVSTGGMTDKHGNIADNNSVITYARFDQNVFSIRATYCDIYPAMLPFDTFARAIAEGGFVFGDYPYEFFRKLSRRESILPIPKFFHGYLFGVGAGLVVALALLISAVMLCICMCCGCFQPKKEVSSIFSSDHMAYVEVKDSLPLVQHISVAVVVLILLSVVGIITAVLCNHHLSQGLIQLRDNVLLVLSDIVLFANSTEKGLLSIFDKLNFTETVFLRDLYNLNQLLGRCIREELEKHIDIGDIVSELKAFEKSAHSIKGYLQQLDTDLSRFKTYMGHFKSNIDTIKQMCAAGMCSLKLPNVSVPNTNVSQSLTVLTMLEQTDLSALLDNCSADLGEFSHNTTNIEQELKDKVKDKLTAVRGYKPIITNFKEAALELLQPDEMKKKVGEISSSLLDIDQIIQQVMLGGLVGMAIPLVMLFVGAVLAPVVLNKFISHFQLPLLYRKERPSVLYTNIVLSFVGGGSLSFLQLSWMCMVVTTVFFAAGALLEGLICSPLCDPELKVGDKLGFTLIGQAQITPGPQNETVTWLARLVGMPAIGITVGSIMKACKERQTLYSAFRMSHNPATNLTELLGFQDQLNLTAMIQDMNVQVPSFNLLTPAVTAYLDNLRQAVEDIPFQELEEIGQKKVADPVRDPFLPGFLRSTLNPYLVSQLDSTQDMIGARLRQLKFFIRPNNQSLSNKINNSLDNVRQSQSKMNMISQLIVPNSTECVANRLTGILDSLVKEVMKNLEEDVGHCRPVYDMVKVLGMDGVCSNISDAVNGLWLSLGWLLLFALPTVILCLWLYKHICKTMPTPPSSSDTNNPTSDRQLSYNDDSNPSDPAEDSSPNESEQFYYPESGDMLKNQGQLDPEGSDLYEYAKARTQEVWGDEVDSAQFHPQERNVDAQLSQPEGSDLVEYADVRMQDKRTAKQRKTGVVGNSLA